MNNLIGQKVKWQVKDYWRQGTVANQNENNVFVKQDYSDKEIELPRNEVCVYEELSDDEVQQYGMDNIETLENIVRKACERLLPSYNNDKDIARIPNEPVLKLLNGTITIEPIAIEVKSIGRIKEFPGWNVIVWKYYPGNRNTPPEYEDCPVGDGRSIEIAAQIVIDTMFKIQAQGYWDNQADEAYAKQMEEEDKLIESYQG